MQPPKNASTHLCNLCCFGVCVCVVSLQSWLVPSTMSVCVSSQYFLSEFLFLRQDFNDCNKSHRRDDSSEMTSLLLSPFPYKENSPTDSKRLVRGVVFRRRVPIGCVSSRRSSVDCCVRKRRPTLWGKVKEWAEQQPISKLRWRYKGFLIKSDSQKWWAKR